MEVYAGMLAYQDAQFGRLLDEIERMGIADNTLVLFIEGDNGASGEAGPKGALNELVHLQSSAADVQENSQWLAQNLDVMGGPKTYECYPVGWALAMDTPFPWLKQIASHLGGVRNGLVISWPNRIKARGESRTQYHHVIDILPTLLDAAHLRAPTTVDGIVQQRIDGTSMSYSFDAPNAPSTHNTQYYEILGNRGIYHDGWLANTTPRNLPWTIAGPRPGSDVTTYHWGSTICERTSVSRSDVSLKEPRVSRNAGRSISRANAYPIQDSSLGFRGIRMARAWGP